MKAVLRFLSTTTIGGLVAVVPIAIIALVLLKVHATLTNLTRPIADLFPFGHRHPALMASLVLLLVCFLAGLLFSSKRGQRLMEALESKVLVHVPFYSLIRNLTRRLAGVEQGETWQPALVEIEEALVPAFIVERHDDERCTVFIPDAPGLMSGALYILTPERVHPLDVPMAKMIKCIRQVGHGTAEFIPGIHAAK